VAPEDIVETVADDRVETLPTAALFSVGALEITIAGRGFKRSLRRTRNQDNFLLRIIGLIPRVTRKVTVDSRLKAQVGRSGVCFIRGAAVLEEGNVLAGLSRGVRNCPVRSGSVHCILGTRA